MIEGTIRNDDTTPTLNVNDVFVSEGNSGTKSMVFTVSLTSAAAETVTVDYATADIPNNAVEGEDYLATSGTLTFAPGETTKTVTVTLYRRRRWRSGASELHLNISNAVGAPVHDPQGRGVISNDDTARFVVDDTTVIEGDSGTSYAVITVRLTTPSTRSIYVQYATSGSNAMLIPGVDYTPTSGDTHVRPVRDDQDRPGRGDRRRHRRAERNVLPGPVRADERLHPRQPRQLHDHR